MALLVAPFQQSNDQFLTSTFSAADTAEYRRLAELVGLNKAAMSSFDSERGRAFQARENERQRKAQETDFMDQVLGAAVGIGLQSILGPVAGAAGNMVTEQIFGDQGILTDKEKLSRQNQAARQLQKERLEFEAAENLKERRYNRRTQQSADVTKQSIRRAVEDTPSPGITLPESNSDSGLSGVDSNFDFTSFLGPGLTTLSGDE